MSPVVFSCEADIHRIGKGFLNRSLPKAEWTHAAHFAATLWLLRFHPELDLQAQLQKTDQYNAACKHQKATPASEPNLTYSFQVGL